MADTEREKRREAYAELMRMEDEDEQRQARTALRLRVTELTGVSLQIGDGWLEIVRDLYIGLRAIDRWHTVGEVKEKYGGLRYHADFSDNITDAQYDAARALIAKAEDEALQTCEDCGEWGQLMRTGQGWLHVLCTTHQGDALPE